jgi:hypothetical protein
MNNDKAFKLVRKFNEWLSEGNYLWFSDDFKKQIDRKENKYPDLDFAGNRVNSKPLRNINIQDLTSKSDFEKTLLAYIWKQGDFNKFENFLKSFSQPELDAKKKRGHVFHQFANHLSNPNEPIIDQHVLRAFKALMLIDSNPVSYEKFEKIRRFKDVTNKEINIIRDYKGWSNRIVEKGFNSKILDDHLFVLGKRIKLP